MAKTARTVRLLQRATQFGLHQAKGMTNIAAWRLVTPGWEKLPMDSQYSRCSEFANHPLVAARSAEVLQHVAVAAMDSQARFHAELIDDTAAARRAQNWTGLAALHRVRGINGGHLRENISITDERGTSDKDLIDRVAKSDPSALPALLAVLGRGGFTAAQPSQTSDSSQVQSGSKTLTH